MFMQPIIETNDFLIFFDWYTYILEFYHIVCLLFVLLKALFSQIQKGYISMQKSFPLKCLSSSRIFSVTYQKSLSFG